MSGQRRAFLIVSGITLCISTALCLLVLFAHQGDPVVFAHTGTLFTNRIAADPDPEITVGYDGQFVYYTARDGFAAERLIDGPSFRFQRILLPIIGRTLALGSPELVPWTLLLTNILAHAIGAGLMAYLLVVYRVSPVLGGLVYGLWIGVILALRLTLTEVLCFALVLGAIATYRQEKYRWTVILLMFSALAKELGLVFALGLALHAFTQGKRRWSILILGAPILMLGVWWAILRVMFGDIPTQYPAARQMTPIPFLGMFTAVVDPLELVMLIIWLAIPTIVLLGLVIRLWWRQRHLTLNMALVLAAAGFVFTIPAVTWGDPVAAYRVATPILIAGLLFVAEVYPKRFNWLAFLWLTPLVILLMLPRLWIGG